MEFVKGFTPPPHREGCKCFRCTKIPWNKGVSTRHLIGEKISKSLKGNKRHEGIYKNKKITYSGLHKWVKRRKKPQIFCKHCNLQKNLELASINHVYTKELRTWIWLCHKCHMLMDKRKKNFSHRRKYDRSII